MWVAFGEAGATGREAAVSGCGNACRRERDKHGENEGRQLAAHPPGIL